MPRVEEKKDKPAIVLANTGWFDVTKKDFDEFEEKMKGFKPYKDKMGRPKDVIKDGKSFIGQALLN